MLAALCETRAMSDDEMEHVCTMKLLMNYLWERQGEKVYFQFKNCEEVRFERQGFDCCQW